MTRAQAYALQWLRDHNADGVFNRNGVLLAGGEIAPVMRSTWNALVGRHLVEFYRPNKGGALRIRATRRGLALDLDLAAGRRHRIFPGD